MSGTYAVLPAAPVVVPAALLVLSIMVWLLHRRRALNVVRTAVAVVTCVYGAAVLQSVLLPFPIRIGAARAGMAPWTTYLQVVPFYDSDPVGYILNVALFVPLGVLLPVVARVSSFSRAAAIGFSASLLVESLQFVLVVTVTSGRVADVDDLLANTVGTVVGFAVFRAATLVPALARIAAAATWPPPVGADQPTERLQNPR